MTGGLVLRVVTSLPNAVTAVYLLVAAWYAGLTVLALAFAYSSPRLILIGLLITGPCCTLLTGRWALTILTSGLALALGVLLGIPDQIFATITQYAFLAAATTIGLTAMLSAAIIQHQRP